MSFGAEATYQATAEGGWGCLGCRNVSPNLDSSKQQDHLVSISPKTTKDNGVD